MALATHARPAPLKRYDVAPGGNSLSGLSSGAFMTVQMHLAHSSCFIGAGVIAGGPYRAVESFRAAAALAEDAYVLNAEYICMSPLTPQAGPDAERSARLARQTAAAGRIDPIENLAGQKVYIFTGTKDAVLAPSTVRATREFYDSLGVQDVWLVDNQKAGHSILTDNEEDLPMGANRPPYINRGGYMQSHVILDYIYGKSPVASGLSSKLERFDQSEFCADYAGRACMGDVGFLYAPAAVKSGERQARGVHIVLHGCKQGYAFVDYVNGLPDLANRATYGIRYATTTGYNYWAEANDLIVLYPQVRARDDNLVQNPEGCWDWWGYSSLDRDAPDYYTKQAVQIRVLYAMLERICGPEACAKGRTAA